MSNEIVLKQASGRLITLRGQQVMLDKDVAIALGGEAKTINQNAKQSPKWDFLREKGIESEYRFQPTKEELENLRSEILTISDFKYLPWVYTRKGCLYFGTSMNSPEACEQAVQLVEVFDKVQETLTKPKKIDYIAIMESQIKFLRDQERINEENDARIEAIAQEAKQNNDTLTHDQISALDEIIHAKFVDYGRGVIGGKITGQIKAAIKKEFFVHASSRTYKEIPRSGFARACAIAENYVPASYAKLLDR